MAVGAKLKLRLEEGKSKDERKTQRDFQFGVDPDLQGKNIHNTEWIEEEYGEKRKILVIDTLFSGAHGAYIPGMVLQLFGQAEGYDLEDPYNPENETIYDALMFLENEVNECLNRLLPSKGPFYIGYHEADGSYCFSTKSTRKKQV